MNYFQQQGSVMPPVVKNLLIANIVVFVAQMVFSKVSPATYHWMTSTLSLNFWESGTFHVYQLVTYMFMHGGFSHLFFNMFALWMFGRTLEYELGSKKFFIYYLVCGIGAGLIQLGVNWIEYSSLISQGHTLFWISGIETQGERLALISQGYTLIRMSTVGASGATVALLLAFGVMHPNSTIVLIFPPIPMKAKWFVIIYGAIQLFSGFTNTTSNIAYFAHLGGMLWGWALLYYWKKKNDIYY